MTTPLSAMSLTELAEALHESQDAADNGPNTASEAKRFRREADAVAAELRCRDERERRLLVAAHAAAGRIERLEYDDHERLGWSPALTALRAALAEYKETSDAQSS